MGTTVPPLPPATKREMKMREHQIENRLVNESTKQGFLCWKWQSTRRGVPDRIVIGNGKVVFVELKAPGEKPTKQQEHVHGLMRVQGVDVRVIDGLEAVDALITELVSYGVTAKAIREMIVTGQAWMTQLPGSPDMVLLNRYALDARSLQMKAILDNLPVMETKA